MSATKCECPARKALECMIRMAELLTPPASHDGSCGPESGCDYACDELATIGATVYSSRAALAAPCPCEGLATAEQNTPLRMYIALKLLRAWNSGTAGYSADVVLTVNEWIDGDMKGPIPWPDNPFFAEWATQHGFSKVAGSVGFVFTAKLTASNSDQQLTWRTGNASK